MRLNLSPDAKVMASQLRRYEFATPSDIPDLVPLASAVDSGWVPVTDTWVYASANTVTVPSDPTLKFQVGDKVMLTQGSSVGYFYVTSTTSAPLTLSLSGGIDYTLTNLSITNIYVSRASRPWGFRDCFNYDPSPFTTNAGTYTATTTFAKFSIKGRVLFHWMKCSGTTSGGLDRELRYELPIVASSVGVDRCIGSGYCINGGAGTPSSTMGILLSTNNKTVAVRRYDSAVWAAAAGTVLDQWGAVELA